MGRKRNRGLSDEDRALWDTVRRSITPLSPARPRPAPPDPPVPKTVAARPAAGPDLPALTGIGAARRVTPNVQVNPAPSIGKQLDDAPLRMDRKAYLRMKRGKTHPEARIDLHGMTIAQAHPALTRFLHDAHLRGLRTVLVITGKGRTGADDGPIPERRGLLKHQVPNWVTIGSLRQIVQQVSEAHFRHGGTGAYYIRLRRHR